MLCYTILYMNSIRVCIYIYILRERERCIEREREIERERCIYVFMYLFVKQPHIRHARAPATPPAEDLARAGA